MKFKVTIRQNHWWQHFGPSMESITLAILAAMVLFTFRVEFHRSTWILGLESALYALIPIATLFWLTSAPSISTDILTRTSWKWSLQTGAIVFAGLPMIAQLVLRPLGHGDSYEIVSLAMLLNAVWFLAVFSRFAQFERLTFALASALVLFVCFMTENRAIYVLAFLYSIVSLWWLLSHYWSRVKVRAIDGVSQSLPVRGAALFGSIAMLALVGVIASAFGPATKALSLSGFAPTSGGDSWHDAYARSGIGDGDMLTAGDNATTTGAVESDQFIEDDRPSMYDIFSEKFEGPAKKKEKQNRAVSLTAETKHMHNVIQSEQAGKTFRTVRQPKTTKEQQLENRISKALFFVEGSVPVRFTVDCFHQFDGWDWTKNELATDSSDFYHPAIMLEKQSNEPWFCIATPIRPYLVDYRAHRIKVMRYGENVLPAPPLFCNWHIDFVEQLGLFRWNEQGLVRMDGDFIPAHTIIDMVSQVPNYHLLRESKLVAPEPFDPERSQSGSSVDEASERTTGDPKTLASLMTQLPENETKACLVAMARDWTNGVPEGWNQVEVIVGKFREEFVLDPSAVPPEDCEDSVGWFLDNGRGPAYLFATAAAQTLRAAGYPTRLATGFIATEADYDVMSNQSPITSDHAHMWPEVLIDGWNWMPVEPTPGYPIPYSTQTLAQWASKIFWDLIKSIANHWVFFLVSGLVLLAVIYWRRLILANLAWLGWWIGLNLFPRHRLKWTRQLLDIRFWAADLTRPSFVCPSSWFGRTEPDRLKAFLRLWESNCFCPSFDAQATREEIRAACQDAVGCLTVSRIKQIATQSQLKGCP